MEYGEAIRNLRQHYELSQAALANLLGVHKQTVSDVERGKQKRFSPEAERRLRELFGDAARAVLDGEAKISVPQHFAKAESAKKEDEAVLEAQKLLILHYFQKLDAKTRDVAFGRIVDLLTNIEKNPSSSDETS